MNDKEILGEISRMVETEHALRDRVQQGESDPSETAGELNRIETQLDQCWDLLRQRRARKEFHQDAEGAEARPINEVESYWA